MGNCKSDISFDEEFEINYKPIIQNSNPYSIFSKQYRNEVDEEENTYNIIDQIEPDCHGTINSRPKRKIKTAHYENCTHYNKNHQHLKPSLKQMIHQNSLKNQQHSAKTVRWDSKCVSFD